jgi:hypothetical protein
MKEPPIFAQKISPPPPAPAPAGTDELTRIFNTAVVATKVEGVRDYSAELCAVMESPGFRAILTAVRTLAVSEGLTERKAAETILQTFRKADRIWGDYLIQEGIDRLKSSPPPSNSQSNH